MLGEAAVETARRMVKVNSMSRGWLLHLWTMITMWKSITSGAAMKEGSTRGRTAVGSMRSKSAAARKQEKVMDTIVALEPEVDVEVHHDHVEQPDERQQQRVGHADAKRSSEAHDAARPPAGARRDCGRRGARHRAAALPRDKFFFQWAC
jgi:hypothetical protein